MSRLDYMRNFMEVVDCGSITAASERLELTVAAVSKRLKSLETELGTRLLTRNTRQLALTEAGHYYYQHCRAILDEVTRVDQKLLDMQGRLSGLLRINMPMTYGKLRLGKYLIEFLQQHPEMQLATHLDDAYADATSGEYDVVIRIGSLVDSSLIARKLEDVYLFPAASPAYLEQYGTPLHPADLNKHASLQYTNMSSRDLWRFQDAAGHEHPISSMLKTRAPVFSNNGDILMAAALAGLGVVILPDFELGDALSDGRLVKLLPDYHLPPMAVYAVYPSRQFLPEKTRALIDFLVQRLYVK